MGSSRKLEKNRKVEQNSESSSGKLGKLSEIRKVIRKIRKVEPNSESSSGKFGKSSQIRKVLKVRPKKKKKKKEVFTSLGLKNSESSAKFGKLIRNIRKNSEG